MRIDVRHEFPELVRGLRRLHADVKDKVIGAALNRTADKARTEMTRRIAEEFSISQKDLRPRLQVSRASHRLNRLVAVLQAFPSRSGKRSMNVIRFGAKQVHGRGRKRVRFLTPQGWRTRTVPVGGGVSVKIRRNAPRQLIKGAFIANQGRTVFIREGGSRLPIKGVQTIDHQQMFNTRRIQDKVVAKILKEFPVEIGYALRRFAR